MHLRDLLRLLVIIVPTRGNIIFELHVQHQLIHTEQHCYNMRHENGSAQEPHFSSLGARLT